MHAVDQIQTRLSLLIRLTKTGSADESAWREFVDIYTPLIYRWCLTHRLQDSDARDVTQQVLLKLSLTLPKFTYDPTKSFRAWLATLTHHAWYDFLQHGETGTGDSTIMAVLASTAAREDLIQRIEEEFDLELYELAAARVKERVDPETWEAFRLNALEGVPAKDVARQLGKKIATIYVARSNVQKMLQEEIEAKRTETP